ncbi:MAG: PCMD domain-containing protein [Coprobacter sp.]|nr:PCMD domain-containing protein [Coprobacter sp.]
MHNTGTSHNTLCARLVRLLSAALLLPGLFSCLQNDIPYPRIPVVFTAFDIEGGQAAIDYDRRTVTLTLDEKTDPRRIVLRRVTVSPDNATASRALTGTLDLENPVGVTLSLYQDYDWTIVARQDIEYRFAVEGQNGKAEIDPVNRLAVAYVSESTDITAVKVTDLKLGPEGITRLTPNPVGQTLDFSQGSHRIEAAWHDYTRSWRILVLPRGITTFDPIAWVNVAWLSGIGLEGCTNGFEYRTLDAPAWINVPADVDPEDPTQLSARLTRLSPETIYRCRIWAEDADGERLYGDEKEFTTGRSIPLENASFDNWHQDGLTWLAYAEGGYMFWDSGNHGSITLKKNVTEPTAVTVTGSGQAARLSSQFVNFSGIGKFAAGNLFTGRFVDKDNTDGILEFGRPFTSYPTRLRGWYDYTTAPIDNNANGYEEYAYLKGRPDSCHIYVALGDWSEPLTIQTSTDLTKRKLFSKSDPHIIAYGELVSGNSTGGYQPFSIELDYGWNGTDNRSRKPAYLIIVCSASKYGDFFTGAAGATLLLDDFSLEYDY